MLLLACNVLHHENVPAFFLFNGHSEKRKQSHSFVLPLHNSTRPAQKPHKIQFFTSRSKRDFFLSISQRKTGNFYNLESWHFTKSHIGKCSKVAQKKSSFASQQAQLTFQSGFTQGQEASPPQCPQNWTRRKKPPMRHSRGKRHAPFCIKMRLHPI